MGQLSRTGGKLLKQVRNRPHASSDDHENTTPPRRAPQATKISPSPSVVESIEVTETASSTPQPPLPLELASGDLRNPKRKQLHADVIDLSRSSPKRARLSATEKSRARSKAESSLPSPAYSESLKSGNDGKGKMQTETDFNADPLSSSDVEQAPTTAADKKHSHESTSTGKRGAGARKSYGEESRATKKSRGAGDVTTPSAGGASGFKVAGALHVSDKKSAGKPEIKIHRFPNYADDEELDASSSDGDIFPGQQSVSKQKQKRGAARSSQSSAGYGSHAKRKLVPPKSYKQPPAAPKLPAAPELVFKRRDLNRGYSARMCAADGSLPDAEELADESEMLHTGLNGDEQDSDDDKLECKICHERLRRTLQEQFEDEILKGKPWSFKWQGRFCNWHKTKTAHEIWQERGYPDVNWDTLRDRMRKHDKFLLEVLNDNVDSYHRDKLHEDGKSGLSRQKDLVTDGKGKFVMGYYGQKGERQVHEYIMTRFANALRKRSSKDKLILATGMQGGVNGIVQLVLAPHLAELLVKEDLQLSGNGWEERAREVLAESAEVGELLFPEEGDKVGEDDYQNHIIENEDTNDDVLDLRSDGDDIEVVELE